MQYKNKYINVFVCVSNLLKKMYTTTLLSNNSNLKYKFFFLHLQIVDKHIHTIPNFPTYFIQNYIFLKHNPEVNACSISIKTIINKCRKYMFKKLRIVWLKMKPNLSTNSAIPYNSLF